MRAIEVSQFGIEHLRLVDRAMPVPGPGELLLRIHAASLNFRDILTADGGADNFPLPYVPASDGASEVIALGSDAAGFTVGDRVIMPFFPAWLDGPPRPELVSGVYGGSLDGFLQEYIAVDAQAAVRAPDHMSFAEAATLPCAGVAAWTALSEIGQIGPGSTVVVQGTGGVSLFALQIAKALGATVIATSSNRERMGKLRDLGADLTISYLDHPDWSRCVLDFTGGAGVDLVVDVGGAATMSESVRAARMGGRIAVLGILTGEVANISLGTVLRKKLRIEGVMVGSRRALVDLCSFMAKHLIYPVIGQVMGIEQTRQAFHMLRSHGHYGKLVISMA